MYDFVTKGKLNRMCKYFRNKNVHIYFEYNDSMGHTHTREYKGIYDKFTIKEIALSYLKEYLIKFYKNDKIIFEEEFNDSASEFYGLGKIKTNNSGPWNYFTITITGEINDSKKFN